MLTAVATAADAPLTLTEREVPEPGPGEVLVRIIACGVCHTDLDLLQGRWPLARFPVVPGHEITGEVAALGPGVSWPAVGTAVGAQFLGDSCRRCDQCVRGEQILCPGKRITGIVMDGGYTEYAVLKADFVTPLPDGLDPVAAAPLMCAGLTAFNSLRRGGITASSRVAVIGTGGVGALAIRYAVAMGARVAAVGRSRRGEAAARELGAERYVATGDTDPAEALRAWDGGADLILNAAPSTAAATAALTGLAPDGTLVLCGYDETPLVLPPAPMVLNRLRVMLNPSGSPHDARDTLAFSAAHGIVPDHTPIGLEGASAALEAMAKSSPPNRSVITFA
ncbi:alcohol dehydrogenase catalytic domain-containing protein [Streptomyces sp. WMMC500]|uniref:alcohol dehydrogenase catalytic domain-containing protein n=1 Tax=Streptomyces sp. WMMC500 TaxID=3015154 RepID=UPI00248B6CA8|nr:alcohol dehydrogenase catalytic domain-containing protein [Streptomyces sp. WMMC500]WBB58036.1 alcohol dehydrogenase catalytic domain-containing protein [Streptomyces sp. WMMC500]